MKKLIYVSLVLIFFTSTNVFAQPNIYVGGSFVLENSSGNGDKEYLAKESITLSDGFHVTASTDGNFRAALQNHVKPVEPDAEAVPFTKIETASISGFTSGSQVSNASEGSQKHTALSYMDGFGKPVQTIAVKSTSNAGSSIIKAFEYDSYGRQLKQYLPFASNNTTSFDDNAISNQASFFSAGLSGLESDSKPYNLTNYESSPISRITSTTIPGDDWHNNNKDSEAVQRVDNSGTIRKWTINGSGDPVSASAYPAKYLMYTEVTNEEGRIFRNYTDPMGNLILTESEGTDASVFRTYYAYDIFGNLLSIIPPTAVNIASSLSWVVPNPDDLCFIYKYDDQNQLIESKNPGVEPIYYVYDKWHRLVLTQDGNQRNANPNKWTFVKYDAFDRPIMTGVFESNSDRATLASDILGSSYGHNEDSNASSVGYSLNQTYPSTASESDLLIINYFDNYSYVSNSGWDTESNNFSYSAPTGFTGTASSNVLDLMTGSKLKILGSSDWLNNVVRYDEKYRVIQVVKENHLGGLDKVSIEYNNFKGIVEKTYFDHTSSGDSYDMLETYEYDANDRLTDKWRSVDGATAVLVENYEYNDLGQLIERNIHSTDGGTSYLQSIDYQYNVQGALVAMNDSGLSSSTDSNAQDDLFGMNLNFSTTGIQINDQLITPKYDGSISSISWKNENPDRSDRESIYGFDYDAQGRLTNSKYATKSGSSWSGNVGLYDTEYSYNDQNGNLETINRNGEKAGVLTEIDDITLDYGGYTNQLEDVSDYQSSTGFDDGVTMTTEFTYDDNGNMTSDLNAQITDITYNILNRPETITIGKVSGNVYIHNTYDALGNKLRMEVEENSETVLAIDYTSGVHYVDDQLAYVKTGEGRVLSYGSNYEHEYAIADYQGNIRSAFGMLHDTDVYYATMESERATEEQADFENLTTDFVQLYNHTEPTIELPNPDRSKFIAPGSSGNIGPAIAIPVSNGDKISAEIYALFDNSNSSNNSRAPSGIVEALASTFGTSSGEGLYSQFSNATSSLVSGWSNSSSVTPDAYLNLIWVSSGSTSNSFAYDPVKPSAYTSYEPLNIEFTSPGAGTVYIYVANESDLSSTDLFLDDFLVVHEKTTSSLNIVSTANYYPFGMKMDADSYDHMDREAQRYGYNGNERIDGGLSLMDFNARLYYPSLGRFMGSDALAAKFASASPYHFASNDPISYSDPTGLEYNPWWRHGNTPDWWAGAYELAMGTSSWDDDEVNSNGLCLSCLENPGLNSTSSFYDWAIYTGRFDLLPQGHYYRNTNGGFAYAEIIGGYWIDYDESIYFTGNLEDEDLIIHGRRSDFVIETRGNINKGFNNLASTMSSPLIGLEISVVSKAVDDIVRGTHELSRDFLKVRRLAKISGTLKVAGPIAGAFYIDDVLASDKTITRKSVETVVTAVPILLELGGMATLISFGATPVGWVAAGVGLIGTAGIMVYDGVQWGMEQFATASVQWKNAYKNGWRR